MSKKKQPKQPFLFEEVLALLNGNGGKALNYRQIASALGGSDKTQRELLISLLADLTRKGLIEEPETGKFMGKNGPKSIEGIIDITQSGMAYVQSPDFPDEICIAPYNTNGSMHGDRVKVKVFARKRNDGRP